ncbi:MAG: mechanosensitive ion channel family protein [Candidatus Methanomethylicaceae archaeon]
MYTKQEQNKSEITKRISSSMIRIFFNIGMYVVFAAVVQWLFTAILANYGINVTDYLVYAQILIALAFGYLIVNSIATFLYWSTRVKYDHPTSAAIRNVVRIIGIGGLVASIAGGVAGGAAGVALGGFMGMVVGFASQQILGQAISGLFLLIARPFKIGDTCVLTGEDGIVEDVSTLFTTVVKADGTKVLIPNNSIMGGKITLKPKQQN